MEPLFILAKRKIAFLSVAVFSLCSAAITNNAFAHAQALSVGIEIAPPVWAPHYERVREVQYYYLPDIEVYYDVWNHEFVYQEGGNWIFASSLPAYYGNYDLYNGHVVVLDVGVREPWRFHHLYVGHYPRYYYHSCICPILSKVICNCLKILGVS